MPIYEYVCRSCGERSEEMRRVAERLDARTCPSCGNGSTALALSVPGMVGAGSQAPAAPSCDMGNLCCGGGPCMN